MGGRALGSMGDLDELEAFLREVEAQGPGEVARITEKPPENIVRLLRDVNNELAEAQREVLQLRDENLALQDEKGKYQSQENERGGELDNLRRIVEENTSFSNQL